MINLVVLEGTLARPAVDVELPSGDRLVQLELTVRRPGATAETVPVVWPAPPTWASALDTGAELVVRGRVRRRFFRAGGSTQSRTEVVADAMARRSARSQARAVLDGARASLEDTGA